MPMDKARLSRVILNPRDKGLIAWHLDTEETIRLPDTHHGCGPAVHLKAETLKPQDFRVSGRLGMRWVYKARRKTRR